MKEWEQQKKKIQSAHDQRKKHLEETKPQRTKEFEQRKAERKRRKEELARRVEENEKMRTQKKIDAAEEMKA